MRMRYDSAMNFLVDSLGVENIIYILIAVAGLVAVVYCTFFTSNDKNKDQRPDDSPLDDHDDSSDD